MTQPQQPQPQPQQVKSSSLPGGQNVQGPKFVPPTRNLVMLSRLYDSTAMDLFKALATKQISYTDERIKNKVQWLGDIAKTLSLVYQIETMRARPKDGSMVLPPEEAVTDPALQKAMEHQFPNQGNNPGLNQFQGWKP